MKQSRRQKAKIRYAKLGGRREECGPERRQEKRKTASAVLLGGQGSGVLFLIRVLDPETTRKKNTKKKKGK